MSKTRALVSLILIAAAQTASATTYIVVFEGTETTDGFAVGGDNPLNLSTSLAAIQSAGGMVTDDLSAKIGIVIATSTNPLFAEALRSNPLVQEVGRDVELGVAEGESTPLDDLGSPSPGEDPLEFRQWGMRMIHAPEAREAARMGDPAVTVAVLDTGIDSTHQDFFLDAQSNIDVARARNVVSGEPSELAILDNSDPLGAVTAVNDFVEDTTGTTGLYLYAHGTHVAGVIGARKNGLGIVGVAPNVTMVPIRIVDLNGFTFPSYLVKGLTYAGEIRADVINISLLVDHDATNDGYVPWCKSDPAQRAARQSIERAVRYARKRGALPITAMGNGGADSLGSDISAEDCSVMPAETPGVVAVGAIDRFGELTPYSDYGLGATDLVAPAGVREFPPAGCWGTITTDSRNSYDCGFGTSLAAPHVSGIAALIVGQYGEIGPDGDMKMNPSDVEEILLGSAIDVGTAGDDLCYGAGRVDALRAVQGDTNYQSDPNVTGCLRYPAP